jgi:hypothetical protein
LILPALRFPLLPLLFAALTSLALRFPTFSLPLFLYLAPYALTFLLLLKKLRCLYLFHPLYITLHLYANFAWLYFFFLPLIFFSTLPLIFYRIASRLAFSCPSFFLLTSFSPNLSLYQATLLMHLFHVLFTLQSLFVFTAPISFSPNLSLYPSFLCLSRYAFLPPFHSSIYICFHPFAPISFSSVLHFLPTLPLYFSLPRFSYFYLSVLLSTSPIAPLSSLPSSFPTCYSSSSLSFCFSSLSLFFQVSYFLLRATYLLSCSSSTTNYFFFIPFSRFAYLSSPSLFLSVLYALSFCSLCSFFTS